MSGYALAFALALVPAGRLGDTLGRRRMFLIALSGLTTTVVGLAATALVLRQPGGDRAAWAVVGPLLLASVFYRFLTGSGRAYPTAVSDALLCACGLMLLALLLAIAELWHRRSRRRDVPTPTPRPPHHLHLT